MNTRPFALWLIVAILSCICSVHAWTYEIFPIFTGDLTQVTYKVVDENPDGTVIEIDGVKYVIIIN